METDPIPSTNLGSLAHSARSKHLKQARGILIAIGVLTILVNGFQFAFAESMVKSALEQEIKKQNITQVDPVLFQEAQDRTLRATYLLCGAVIAMGVLFVVFGIIVQRFPVPIMVTSLVLYIGCAAIFGVLDPTTLAQGLIVKVIFVFGLIKGLQAAIASQKELAIEEANPTPL